MIAIVAALVVVVRGRVEARSTLGAAAALVAIWVGLLLSYSQSSFAGLIVAVVAAARARAGGAPRCWPRRSSRSSSSRPASRTRTSRTPSSSARAPRSTARRATAPGSIYNGLRIAVRNPVVGVGVGAFRHHYAALTHLKGKEPKKAASHDTPVTVAAENGLVGLGALRLGARRRVRRRSPARVATRSCGGSCSRSALGLAGDRRALALLRPLLRGPDDLGACSGSPGSRSRARRSGHSAGPLEPGRSRPAHPERDAAAGLGRLGPRQPDEHLEPRPAAGSGPPRRLVEPDGDEHVVAVELAARRRLRAAAAPRAVAGRGRSARAARARRRRTARAPATPSSTAISPSTDWTTPFSSRPSSRFPWPTNRATSPLTGRV